MVDKLKNKLGVLKYLNSILIFTAVVVSLFSISNKDTKGDSGLMSFFDGINRAHADMPHTCDSCVSSVSCGDSGDSVCANCVSGCSYSDGSSGGSGDSGSSDCGASSSSPGGACDSCASSGTGCGLY